MCCQSMPSYIVFLEIMVVWFFLSSGAIQERDYEAEEASVLSHMGNFLRSAPDRKGGGGRQKGQTAVDLASDSE